MAQITWLSAFLDLAPESFDEGVGFWRGVTGCDLSTARGDHDEFATLLPPEGDAHLRVQRLREGPSRIHVDVHAPDHEFAVRRSPGGLTWCTVAHPASVRPPAATWPGGHRSQVDQICLDIPADVFDEECAFWSGLTGWAVTDSPLRAEFRRLQVPDGVLMKVLLQRLDEPTGSVRAHLDLASDDRAAETRRHVALGAEVVDVRPRWTVLRDPAGTPYCITQRSLDAPESRVHAEGGRR